MNPALADLIRGLTARPPQDVKPLLELASARGVTLPADYMDYMSESDGGEGDVGSGYVEIWPVAKVLHTAELEPAVYDDFLAFAGDGANIVYGFDAAATGEIVEGDWIGLGRDEVIPRGRTFMEFLQSLAEEG
jgi:hypothetical protein